MTTSEVPAAATSSIYAISSSDPHGELIDRADASEQDLEQISRLMAALGSLRDAEQRLSDASHEYMQLNRTDMRALHFLIVAANLETLATPGALASHLEISSASTTKLIDRLERAGHVVRSPHPTDRRALVVSVTPQTRQAAMETVGRQQAKRFEAAARLSPEARETVIDFLEDMTDRITLRDEPWAQRDPH